MSRERRASRHALRVYCSCQIHDAAAACFDYDACGLQLGNKIWMCEPVAASAVPQGVSGGRSGDERLGEIIRRLMRSRLPDVSLASPSVVSKVVSVFPLFLPFKAAPRSRFSSYSSASLPVSLFLPCVPSSSGLCTWFPFPTLFLPFALPLPMPLLCCFGVRPGCGRPWGRRAPSRGGLRTQRTSGHSPCIVRTTRSWNSPSRQDPLALGSARLRRWGLAREALWCHRVSGCPRRGRSWRL